MRILFIFDAHVLQGVHVTMFLLSRDIMFLFAQLSGRKDRRSSLVKTLVVMLNRWLINAVATCSSDRRKNCITVFKKVLETLEFLKYECQGLFII